jgi:site-specific recombinase XerD
MSKSAKVEDDPIWDAMNGLVERMYETARALPDEERWQSAHKLRSSAVDLLFFAAQGLGATSPGAASFEWASARKQVVALKALYRFVGRQKFINLEPEVMLELDKLTKAIDAKLAQEALKTKQQEADDLKPWLKKYEIWKKISE